MRKLILSFSLLFCYSEAWLQKAGEAILLDTLNDHNIYSDSIYNCFIHSVSNTKSSKPFTLYLWNSISHAVRLEPSFATRESPSSEAVFIKPYTTFMDRYPLKLIRDTANRIIEAYLATSPVFTLEIKGVEVATSVLNFTSKHNLVSFPEEKLTIPLGKYFNADPDVIMIRDKKSYDKSLNALYSDYANQIRDLNLRRMSYAVNAIKYYNADIICADQQAFEVITEPGFQEKSVKEVKIKAGSKQGIIPGRDYACYAKRKVGSQTYYEHLDNIEIKLVEESTSVGKTPAFSGRDLAKSYKAGDIIMAVPRYDKRALNRLNMPVNQKAINLSIKKECLFCENAAQQLIINNPILNLVERNAPELKYFASLLKDERFIDYSIADLQGRQSGYRLLITFEGNDVIATDIETNRIVSNSKVQKKFFDISTTAGFSVDDLSLILSSFDPEHFCIRVTDVLEQKKEKINTVLMYNPAGFERATKFEIYKEESIDVDGEKIKRKTVIGDGKIGKIFSSNLAELNIKNGESEVYMAYSRNEPIFVQYKN
ncbi:MAG: hypothetical protein K1X68_06455 [Saprospiraceae bacterium]|nr:hypothetical protein [Saprospiraceae bacterium]HMX88162.1 hypothetical protein [Saprospiraceae bacterium]HMZ39901.1 hypothetical protein [Saprospiraceae bacterium]HNA63984.1 hypothetical protein [Saprospiraceae bacterium]HNB29587.1 hypothetical protein [Saprospiraceae bacterium]